MRYARFALLLGLLLSISCGGASRVGQTFTPSPPASPPGPPASPALRATLAPPAYVPPQCAGLPLATIPAATTVAQPTAALQSNPVIDADVQLGVLEGLVQALQDHYIYPEALSETWMASVDETRHKIEAGLDTETFYGELQSLVSSLGDEHSYVQSPQEISAEQADLGGTFHVVGVGALFQPMLEKGWPTILAVLDGSPAAYAGLQPHDDILAVDGMPIGRPGLIHREWTRGPECSAVVLTVRSPGQAPRDLTLIRAAVSAPLPIEALPVPTTDGSRIAYVFIPTLLGETVGDQVRQAIESAGPLDGLILDNRMNGGGLGSVTAKILGLFTSGVVGHFVTREASEPWSITADPVGNSQDVPLVVLIGEDTVSYGEVMSGVLHDIGRAALIGQTSLGNVEQLRQFDFQDGSRAWLAAARFEPLNSTANWETEGIVPDVEVIADWDTFTFDTDPAIAAALKLLGH